MTTRDAYTYRVLQYRHDPVAGELINVGVMVHCVKRGYLDVRMRDGLGRLSKLYADFNRRHLTDTLRGVEVAARAVASDASRLMGLAMDAESVSERLIGAGDGCLHWGAVGGGLTTDPSVTLDKLFERLVIRHDVRTGKGRVDADVWRPVDRMLAERKIKDRLTPKTITSSIDHVEFAHAWKNGAWHCYQPLSFDLTDEEGIREKARRWVGALHCLSDAEEGFRPYFLIGAPQRDHLSQAYHAALRMLEKSPLTTEIYEEAQVIEFVDRIEDGMRRHDGGGSGH